MSTIVRVVLPDGKGTYQSFRDLPRKDDALVLTIGDDNVIFVAVLVMHYSIEAGSRREQCPDVFVREREPGGM